MADDHKPAQQELGLYVPPEQTPRITVIEVIALVLTALWLAGVIAFFQVWESAAEQARGGPGSFVMTMLGVLMPIALIWVAASAARTARVLREEAARLQASVDAMRAAFVSQQQGGTADYRPAVTQKLDEIARSQRKAETALATFTSQRAGQPERPIARPPPRPAADAPPQPALALGTPPEALADPISIPDFISALHFPETEHDKEGFRTLRRALEDPRSERLIRASQDVLTLLSQDGIYMDDLRPDRAKPDVWRRFAQGERGRGISALGGVRDRSSLTLAAGRMKSDPVFRDAVHHFLRQFDRTFLEFEQAATDADIAALSDTRTARAFMLVGRVAGVFD